MASSYAANKRWRDKRRDLWNMQKQRNYAQSRGGKVTRRRWTEEEDQQVLNGNEASDGALSKHLNRTVQAIQVRRSKLLKAPNTRAADSS